GAPRRAVAKSGRLHRTMKAMLPKAVFIGFTGTPLLNYRKRPFSLLSHSIAVSVRLFKRTQSNPEKELCFDPIRYNTSSEQSKEDPEGGSAVHRPGDAWGFAVSGGADPPHGDLVSDLEVPPPEEPPPAVSAPERHRVASRTA